MTKNYNKKFDYKLLVETITLLQNKIKELEKKIEDLEFQKMEQDFKLCRENAFSFEDFESFEDDFSPKNAGYFHLD